MLPNKSNLLMGCCCWVEKCGFVRGRSPVQISHFPSFFFVRKKILIAKDDLPPLEKFKVSSPDLAFLWWFLKSTFFPG